MRLAPRGWRAFGARCLTRRSASARRRAHPPRLLQRRGARAAAARRTGWRRGAARRRPAQQPREPQDPSADAPCFAPAPAAGAGCRLQEEGLQDCQVRLHGPHARVLGRECLAWQGAGRRLRHRRNHPPPGQEVRRRHGADRHHAVAQPGAHAAAVRASYLCQCGADLPCRRRCAAPRSWRPRRA